MSVRTEVITDFSPIHVSFWAAADNGQSSGILTGEVVTRRALTSSDAVAIWKTPDQI